MSARKLIDEHKRRLRESDAGREVITPGGIGLSEAVAEHEAEKATFTINAVRGDGVIGKLTLPAMTFRPLEPDEQMRPRGRRGDFVVEMTLAEWEAERDR